MILRNTLLAVALLAPLYACAERGAADPDGPRRPNVLLIVVDTLRADRLGAYGHERPTSPHLDALAAEGVLYPQALATAPWTTPSIAALLTSRYPSSLGIQSEKVRVADEAETLAEVLRDAGYLTGAAVSHSFCNSKWGFDQGFAGFDESNVQGHAAVTSEGVTERGRRFLDEAAAGDQPWMLWLHYFDPHCAYVEDPRFPMGGRGDYDGRVKNAELYRDVLKKWRRYDAADWDEMRRLYDSEIARTDAAIGALLGHLDSLGVADDTLVIVTADHGEEFGDHGGVGHAKTLFGEVLHVPLIVRYPRDAARFPGGQPGPKQDWVSLVDVAPTVLDVCALPTPAAYVGQSLLRSEGDELRYVFGETHRAGGLRTVIGGGFKLIRWQENRRTALFDLRADPLEQDDLSHDPAFAERRKQLEAVLDAHLEQVQTAPLEAPAVDESAVDAEHLKDLGYAGAED